jgi:ABC-type Fe3+ transport system permease subunit
VGLSDSRPGETIEESRRSLVALGLWVASVAVFALFLAFGSVTVNAGFLRGRSSDVTRIWERFAANLDEVGPAAIMNLTVIFLVAVTLVAGALGLLFALLLTNDNDAALPAHLDHHE